MSRWRCASCGGEYEDTSVDGVPYFHGCPPVVDPATGAKQLRPGHRDETVVQEPDPQDQTRRLVRIRAEGRGRAPAPAAPPGPPGPPGPP